MQVDIPQQSAQWVRERIGCLTASRMGDVLAVLKNGKPAEARTRYMRELLAERLTDAAMDHFVTPAMLHGIENEPAAADAYEALTGELLMPAGFFRHPTIEHFGASPDRLLGSDGLVEIKCPSTVKFIEWRAAGEVPAEHKPQMLAQLACTRRRFVDFVGYDPRIKDPKLRLFVRRFEPPMEEIERIEQAARDFLDELERAFEQLTAMEPA